MRSDQMIQKIRAGLGFKGTLNRLVQSISWRNKWPKLSTVVIFDREGENFLAILKNILLGVLIPLKWNDEFKTILAT